MAFWLAGQIGGEDRAKVIQLSMEYDPQPPFDSGHMSKASAKTKAVATALMARDIAKPTQLKAGTQLLWNHALAAARAKVARRWRELLERHDEIERAEITSFQGSVIKHTGDGLLATFDGKKSALS